MGLRDHMPDGLRDRLAERGWLDDEADWDDEDLEADARTRGDRKTWRTGRRPRKADDENRKAKAGSRDPFQTMGTEG
jgi:hypothetical protein